MHVLSRLCVKNSIYQGVKQGVKGGLKKITEFWRNYGASNSFYAMINHSDTRYPTATHF